MEKVAEIFGIPVLIDKDLPSDSIGMISRLDNGVHCVVFHAGEIKDFSFSHQELADVFAKYIEDAMK
jgi:hypothetical protein